MSLEHRATRVIFAVVVALSLALNTAILALNDSPRTLTNATYSEPFHSYFDPDQYAYLGDAFLHGQLSLDLPVAPEFEALEDPYSYEDRWEIASDDVRIYWDYAYCDGKYYCYFGAVPALLLYAPYQLVTGQYLSTPYAVAFAAALAIIALALLTWRIARRYFSQTATLGSLLVAFITLFLVCNFSYLTFVARFYSVPILFSVLFTCLGLWFWLGARRESAEDGARLSTAHLIGGSTCIALTIGCRPQFILFALLAFFIFRQEIFRERLLFSHAGLSKTIAAIAPILIICGLQMAYNYARFGSVLDFGSSRNLTGFNMRDYHQNKLLTMIYFAFYLVRPLEISGKFPFISSVNTTYPELGWSPEEPFFGGIFMLVPVLLLIFALPLVWKTLKRPDRGWGWGFIVCIVLALGILLIDIRLAGITERYFSDFALFLGLVVVFMLFALEERIANVPDAKRALQKRRIFMAAIWVLTVFAVFICILRLFTPEHFDSIGTTNPALWSQICTFWGI